MEKKRRKGKERNGQGPPGAQQASDRRTGPLRRKERKGSARKRQDCFLGSTHCGRQARLFGLDTRAGSCMLTPFCECSSGLLEMQSFQMMPALLDKGILDDTANISD